ncbi:MAG: lipopolysaccharide biosynthesis protein [Acidimicrobiales bacterium]|nr:lipopolysaccharide biosynthesis protein [Acidimicrobiales bacterium]
MTGVASPPDRPFVRAVVRGTAAAGATTVWTVALSLLSVPLFLGALGPAGFGAWVLVQTFSAFRGWGALLDIGTGTSAMKLLAERLALGERDEAAEIGTAALVVSAIGGLAGAGLLVLAVQLGLADLFGIEGDERTGFNTAAVMFALAIPIDLVNRTLHFTLEGLQRVDLSRWCEVVRRTLVVVATVVAARATGDLGAVGLAYLAVSVPTLGLSWFIVRRHLPARRPTSATGVELLRYGSRIAAIRPLGTVHRMMDRLIVGAILGPSAVSLVEIATLVQGGAQAVVAAGAHAIIPSAAWLRARGAVEKQRQLVLRGTQLTVIAVLPLVIGPAIAANELVGVWLGGDGADAAALIPIALAYAAVVAFAHVASEFLIGVGRPGVVFRAAVVALIVNLLLTLVLVPLIGVVGAFVGSLVAVPLSAAPTVLGALRATDASGRDFVRATLRPLVAPGSWIVAIAVLAVLGPFGDLTTIALIATVGGLGYAALVMQRVDIGELVGRSVPAG